MSYIETFTGKKFYPLAPVTQDISITDIAHALSNQCRFAGHCRKFYSVAEHSCRVSYLLEDWGECVHIQMWGLLHDASEAYLVDLPTPLKKAEFGVAYREAEQTLMREICNVFSLSDEMPSQVRTADEVLLATEARDLMECKGDNWDYLRSQPLAAPIHPLPPQEAFKSFLARYFQLRLAR